MPFPYIRKKNPVITKSLFFNFLLVLTGTGFTLPASADLFTIVGDTTGAPTFDRPNCPASGNICKPVATLGGQRRYQALRFRVTQGGTWQIGTNTPLGTDHPDTHLSLYQDSFDPSRPLQNVLLANDDNNIFGAGFDSGIVGPLSTNTTFISVVSSFGAGEFGRYLLLFLGPGSIILSDAEIATAAQNASITASRSFMGNVMRRIGKRRSNGNLFAVNVDSTMLLASADPLAGVSAGSHYRQSGNNNASFWATGYGGDITFDGESGSSTVDSHQGGIAFGYDRWISQDLIAGVAVSAGRSFYDIDAFTSEGDSSDYNIAIYGGWNRGPWYADALLGYGRNSHEIQRSVVGATGVIEADFHTDQLLFGGEIGKNIDMHNYLLSPFVRTEVTSVWQEDYTENESGGTSGLVPLSVNDRNFTAVRTILGLHTQHEFTVLDNKQLILDVEVGWAHEFNNDRKVKASTVGIPGFVSSVPGAGPDSDLAVYSIAVEMPIKNSDMNGFFFLGYHGQKGNDVTDHNGFGGFRFLF